MTDIYVQDDRIYIETAFKHKDRCKAITGARWHPESKRWYFAATPDAAHEAFLNFQSVGYHANEDFHALVDQYMQEQANRYNAMTMDEAALPDFDSKTTPYEHQKRAFWFVQNTEHGAMLAMDMGTGKSKVAVDICVNREAKLVWIAAPKSVIGVWSREFERHAARPFWVVPLQHRTVKQKYHEAVRAIEIAQAHSHGLVLVTNHEAIWRDPLNDLVKQKEPDVIIIDESHRGKQHDGRFSRYLATLAHLPFKLLLTGTPMPHSPLDIFAQYRFLDPPIFGTSYWQFRRKYAVMGGFENHEVVAYQNTEDLNERFYRRAFAVKLEDCFDLPEYIDEERTFELSKEGRAIYDRMERDMVVEIQDGLITADNAMVSLLRLQQMTSGYARDEEGKDHPVDPGKAKLLHETLEDIKEPVIVFCRFRHDLDVVNETTIALGRTYGELSGARRDALNEHGELAEGIDVAGVQIQAGGVGVDFVSARYAIYFSLGFSLSDYLQSRRRLHRHGQKRSVVYLHLVAEDTVDQTVYAALERRDNLIKAVLARAETEGKL